MRFRSHVSIRRADSDAEGVTNGVGPADLVVAHETGEDGEPGGVGTGHHPTALHVSMDTARLRVASSQISARGQVDTRGTPRTTYVRRSGSQLTTPQGTSMGLTYTSICVQCGVRAPEIGDSGYMGTPVADFAKRRRGLQTFGSIYAGLAAIGAITVEIEAFKAFLDEHGAHPIVQYSDTGYREFGDEADFEKERSCSRETKFHFDLSDVEETFFELHCETCDATCRSMSSGLVLPFEARFLTPAEIALFRSNASSLEFDNFYKVYGFPFDDLALLDGFLADHASHSISSRCTHGESSATLDALDASDPSEASDGQLEAGDGALGPVEGLDELRLVMRLRHRDPAARCESALQIGRLGKSSLLGYLVSLGVDPESSVRATAAAAIGSLDDPRALRLMGQLLLDESEIARAAARGALERVGITEVAAVDAARRVKAPNGLPAFADNPEGWASALRDSRERVRIRAMAPLEKKRQPWAADLLLIALADPSHRIRSHAAQTLGRRWKALPAATEFLIAALDDYNSLTVVAAVRALGKLQAEPAVPHIRRLLLSSSISFCETMDALRIIGGDAAVDALLDALSHPSAEVRVHAAYVLGTMKAPRAAGKLIAALSDPSRDVRASAAGAVAQLRDPEVLVALAENFRRPSASESERETAVAALAKLGGRSSLRILVAALRDPSEDVRTTAAAALTEMNDPRGNRALLARARRGDSVVAREAWRLLVGQGLPGTEQALADVLEDDEESETATELAGCLLQCGNEWLEGEARRWFGDARPPRRRSKVKWGDKARPA